MKNKKTKAFLYQNLYPINLYVALIDDWDDVNNFFDFFITTDNLRNDEVNGGPSKPVNASAATYLVREKNTRAIGILILIGDYSSSTLAHESIHYADAVYDFLKMNAEGGQERFCRAGIGAARYFNPKHGSANLYCRRPFFGGRGVGGWVLRVRPTHATTPTGLCFGALRHLPLCP